MPTLRVGRKEIQYELRRSDTASERRIIVTPDQVEVVALPFDRDEDIAGFLNRKRQWLFNTVREVEKLTSDRHSVPRFITGSKIPYRGRSISLRVRRTDANHASVAYRNGFLVDLPNWASSSADALVASELRLWLKQRARRDVQEIAAGYCKRFGLKPRAIRTTDLTRGWGSCSAKGSISINWQLIFAPRKVLEYVVVHELAHLKYRSHGKVFWDYLATLMPSYQEPKIWLEKYQSKISADFLNCN